MVDRPTGDRGHADDRLGRLRAGRAMRARRTPRSVGGQAAGAVLRARPSAAPRRRTGCRRSARGCARPRRSSASTHGSSRPARASGRGPAGAAPGARPDRSVPARRATAAGGDADGARRRGRSSPARSARSGSGARDRRRGPGSRGPPSGGPRRRGRRARWRPAARAWQGPPRTAGPAGSRHPSEASRTVGPRAGTSRARSARAPSTTVSMVAGSRSRTRPRSASTIGPNGRPPSPMFAQPPARTRMPARGRDGLQLGGEPGLADAGLAGHEEVDRGVRRRPVERTGHGRPDLVLAPDEGRADGRPIMVSIIGAPIGRRATWIGGRSDARRPSEGQAPAPAWATARSRSTAVDGESRERRQG